MFLIAGSPNKTKRSRPELTKNKASLWLSSFLSPIYASRAEMILIVVFTMTNPFTPTIPISQTAREFPSPMPLSNPTTDVIISKRFKAATETQRTKTKKRVLGLNRWELEGLIIAIALLASQAILYLLYLLSSHG